MGKLYFPLRSYVIFFIYFGIIIFSFLNHTSQSWMKGNKFWAFIIFLGFTYIIILLTRKENIHGFLSVWGSYIGHVSIFFREHFSALILGLVAVLLFARYSIDLAETGNFSFSRVTHHGSIFPVAFAFLTLAGLLAALSRIEELHSKITNLHGFVIVATSICKEAEKKREPVWIVSVSPFIGNLSIRGRNVQKEFAETLAGNAARRIQGLHTRANIDVTLACLAPRELGEYYLNFARDARYDKILCKEAHAEMKDYLVDATRIGTRIKYYGLKENPGFFLVATSSRALVAMPLFLPVKGAISDETTDDKVQLVGFLTREKKLVRELLEAAEHYAKPELEMTKRTTDVSLEFDACQNEFDNLIRRGMKK